jgi:hypothetical protein
MSSKYTEYVRSQVHIVSFAGFLILGFITIVTLIPALSKKEFQFLSVTIKPNVTVLLISFALTLSILVCYLIGRKHTIASEFVSPLFTLCFLLISIPTLYENPKTAVIIHHQSLLQLLNQGYLFNFAVSCFFSASYLPAVASRLVLNSVLLNVAIRRHLSGEVEVLPVLFNFIASVSFSELNAYNSHRKTI